jgi:hypothetical protein
MARLPISRPPSALAVFALAAVVVFLVPGLARAEGPPAPGAGTWGAELESVAQWLAARNAAPACTEHCFVLTRLRLSGPADGEMKFAMEGAVLADRPVAVPLFGPPVHARVDHVTENGKPAAVGFEGDHWFVLTASRRFLVEGTLALEGDLALTIPGPLDTLDAELARGRVVEGAHLSGLSGVTVHFDRDATATPAAEPPVFQLSRAVRIGRETTFEYHLVMRSGQDLGVVRLPLRFGEKVLDVQGSTGWNVQGTELVLPTAGRAAEVTITGALASAGHFEPDARSAYEWLLVESDAEHRMSTAGDARQVDVSQSPIARTQPGARLFLVGRGQHVDVSTQTLVATEALAAVVRDHRRTLVLTARGDLVADDVLSYENDGIDWLVWPPDGRAVFLGTDGKSERVMRQADGAGEVLVPLRVGSHTVHLQSMSGAAIAPLWGQLAMPTPSHALTTSRATLTLGLPARVHPLAVMGGDHPWFAFGAWDVAALAASIGIAFVALRGRLRRTLGAVALGGLWLGAPLLWQALVGSGALVLAAWAASRLLPRGPRIAAWSALGLAAFVGGIASMSAKHAGSRPAAADVTTVTTELPSTIPTATAYSGEQGVDVDVSKGEAKDKREVPAQAAKARYFGNGWRDEMRGDENGRFTVDGIAPGVAPVALPLPAYEQSIVVTRELVTHDRPLNMRVTYVTTTGLAPLVAAWLACIAWLTRLSWPQIGRLVRAVRERLAHRPDPDPAPAAPPAPPPVIA